MLVKVAINDETNDKIKEFYTPSIKLFLENNNLYKGLIIEDYLGNIHTDLAEPKLIYHKFNNFVVAISSHSFQQNHQKLGDMIRKYVASIIKNTVKNDNILSIGGESYLYGLTTNNKVIHLTNNENIKNDCDYNFNVLYNNTSKLLYNKIVNYNAINEGLDETILNIINNKTRLCILNLSKLNNDIIELLNLSNINKIIIINCHHNDFWKKTKKLNNFKLITRQKFICYEMKYFITVNVFVKKTSIIPFGNNCAIAYQLKKLNIRNTSYPFDWCSSTLPKLINTLENDFTDFTSSISIQKKSYNHKPINVLYDDKKLAGIEESECSYILSNKYDLKFAHEVLDSKDINEFKQVLERRLFKLKKCINPMFLRLENKKINIENYKKIVKLLDSMFQNYKLIVLTFDYIDYKTIFKSSKIKFIKVANDFEDWKYNNINWKEIISDN